MCEICGRFKCPSVCPNADEPKAIEYCSHCGHAIYGDDCYFEYKDNVYCEDCLSGLEAIKTMLSIGAKDMTDYSCDDETVVGVCEGCGENILACDCYYKFNGKLYHEDCLSDNCIDILCECGAVSLTAEPEADYDD